MEHLLFEALPGTGGFRDRLAQAAEEGDGLEIDQLSFPAREGKFSTSPPGWHAGCFFQNVATR
jgi:hypothetical protein